MEEKTASVSLMERASEVNDDAKTSLKNHADDLSPRAYLLIPLHKDFLPRRRSCSCFHALLFSTLHTLLLLSILASLSIFLLWPSNPEIRLSRMKLRSLSITTKHKGTLVALNVAMDLKIRVHNRAFLSLDYDNVTVAVEYRGRRLGSVAAGGGAVEARGVSFVAARLELNGVRVLEDAIFLVEDLVKGKIPLDTVTIVNGDLRVRSLQVPIQVRMLQLDRFVMGGERIVVILRDDPIADHVIMLSWILIDQ